MGGESLLLLSFVCVCVSERRKKERERERYRFGLCVGGCLRAGVQMGRKNIDVEQTTKTLFSTS